jgi:predicted nucleic acid-binding protein
MPAHAATFRIWAHRRSDTLIEDAMIAATAQHHGFQVVTRYRPLAQGRALATHDTRPLSAGSL